MHTAETAAEFVLRNTRASRTPLVPEIELLLGNMVIPLWELVESEFEQQGLAPPYWAFAWPGGQALARYILDEPSLACGRTVLDFASGSGIAGIAAARAGALSVLCADTDPLAAAACALNGVRNHVSLHTTTDDLIGSDLVPDLVLAGDICYERNMSSRSIKWLEELVLKGAMVLLGDPGRNYLPKSGLAHLSNYPVKTSLDLEDRETHRTDVYCLTA
ncbi:MAG TPA: 50S ribosomal protein L11 methyltransferase [Alphaproteobacteria bacterium]|nr:50S ribosomal protein L11 methyltransferase [Alphaproteobacteria bacterium]